MTTARPGAGPLLREWRVRRRRSQLDLAHEVGTSPRHLSFIETGRSTPGRALLLDLARHLEVPLRDRNAMLLAAGLAPEFHETSIDDPNLRMVRTSLVRLLRAHDPYPGLVLDRHWNIVLANTSAEHLLAALPPVYSAAPVNLFRVSLAPDGLAAYTTNFAEWAEYLLDELHRLVARTGDAGLADLQAEVLQYPNVAALRKETEPLAPQGDAHPILIPCRLTIAGDELTLFSTLTTFGTPRDVTLDELTVELFFPSDEPTDTILRSVG